MPITTCIFDAYGTLLDVNAAAREAAAEPRREALVAVWPELAANWRAKQLSYTWLRAITGDHVDFWQVTQDALDWSMEKAGLADPELRARLLDLYRELSPFPEAREVLTTLQASGLYTGILSNGTPDMLRAAAKSAGIADTLDDILSVETVGVYKPASAVYDLVTLRFGTPKPQVLFVSSNGWDAAGAARFGFTTVWVNRGGDPVDRLPGRPAHVVADLTAIPAIAGVA